MAIGGWLKNRNEGERKEDKEARKKGSPSAMLLSVIVLRLHNTVLLPREFRLGGDKDDDGERKREREEENIHCK